MHIAFHHYKQVYESAERSVSSVVCVCVHQKLHKFRCTPQFYYFRSVRLFASFFSSLFNFGCCFCWCILRRVVRRFTCNSFYLLCAPRIAWKRYSWNHFHCTFITSHHFTLQQRGANKSIYIQCKTGYDDDDSTLENAIDACLLQIYTISDVI